MSQSLERGLAVLALFKSGPLMGVSEIGRALDLSRSTAHRYVATLAALGYLQQDRESKRYRLGPRVLDLGFSAINSMDVREISAPHLQQLSDETGPHGQHGDPRRRRHRLHRALPRLAPGQREIDLNLHIGARLPGLLHGDGQGDARVPARGGSRRS